MDISLLSSSARTILLARIAHQLTVSARSTYEKGTENISEPQVLRAYNELLHRITSSERSHVEGEKGMPLEAVLQMMHDFGVQFNRTDEINWVIKSVQDRPLPP
jgi:hypothetical protein